MFSADSDSVNKDFGFELDQNGLYFVDDNKNIHRNTLLVPLDILDMWFSSKDHMNLLTKFIEDVSLVWQHRFVTTHEKQPQDTVTRWIHRLEDFPRESTPLKLNVYENLANRIVDLTKKHEGRRVDLVRSLCQELETKLSDHKKVFKLFPVTYIRLDSEGYTREQDFFPFQHSDIKQAFGHSQTDFDIAGRHQMARKLIEQLGKAINEPNAVKIDGGSLKFTKNALKVKFTHEPLKTVASVKIIEMEFTKPEGSNKVTLNKIDLGSMGDFKARMTELVTYLTIDKKLVYFSFDPIAGMKLIVPEAYQLERGKNSRNIGIELQLASTVAADPLLSLF